MSPGLYFILQPRAFSCQARRINDNGLFEAAFVTFMNSQIMWGLKRRSVASPEHLQLYLIIVLVACHLFSFILIQPNENLAARHQEFALWNNLNSLSRCSHAKFGSGTFYCCFSLHSSCLPYGFGRTLSPLSYSQWFSPRLVSFSWIAGHTRRSKLISLLTLESQLRDGRAINLAI
jgi:hypothetical protein